MPIDMNGRTLQSPLLIECIRACYHVQVVSLHRLPSDSGKSLYQVNLANGVRWILRVGEVQNRASFVELAQLLVFFEQHNYPAERIVFTVGQTPLATASNWLLLMTTFLVGTPPPYTPATFSQLGAIVGRLHALKSALTYVPAQAKMLPVDELAFAQQELSAVASHLSRPYIAQYEVLEKALWSMDRGTYLPTTLIHNDCHPANALMTASGHIMLFDWEEAGMGSAVLDVGFLLVNCDGKAPWDPLSLGALLPDAALLQAVIEGYGHYHPLTPVELDYLPDAIRFRSLVFGVCNFASAIKQQKSAEFSQWWWHRYCAAEWIADQARRFFEHILQ